jgi:DNA polymerase-3 subunit beta
MEFTISRENIIKGLSKIQSIVERRNTMPILSNALIKTDKDSLSISATDLEVSFSGKIPAEIIKEGTITVSAKKLYEIIKEFPDEDIYFNKDENNWLIIKCANINFKVVGLPADEFPSLPEDTEESSYSEIDKKTLKDMIDKTIFSVSTEESRVNLSGVYLERVKSDEGGGIKMIATDGHRLSLSKSDIDVNMETPVIIPRKGVMEIKKILDDTEGDTIKFKIVKNNCVVKIDDATLFIRLIDEMFPNYNQVIPKDNEYKVEIDKSSLLKSLKRISLLSTEKYKGVKFQFEKGVMTITSNNSEYGEAKESLNVDCSAEEELIIGLNARYIMDVLNVTGEEKVIFDLKNETSQCLIRPKGNDNFISVIMPMRL